MNVYPCHVAIIMDGNGRWAEQRGLNRVEGHRAGVKNIHSLISHLDSRGVKYVTLYAFSTENWNRPEDEVAGIFHILEEIIGSESMQMNNNGFRIRHIGSLKELPIKLQASIKASLKLTENNKGLNLSIALNYGGRAEIIEAVNRIITEGLKPEQINEKVFQEHLYTAGLPDVDLVIRTGGEMRISNLLLWQTAYSEYYFTPVLWPDFTVPELDKALEEFSRRKRRFGGLQSKDKCSEKDS
jgi:undecaprenyl diphosphate synthase